MSRNIALAIEEIYDSKKQDPDDKIYSQVVKIE